MNMALSEAKKAAYKRHTAKLDQIMIRPYKEKGAEIRHAAKARGMSIQAYILEAVQMRMDREANLPEAAEPLKQLKTPEQPSVSNAPVRQTASEAPPVLEESQEQLPI